MRRFHPLLSTIFHTLPIFEISTFQTVPLSTWNAVFATNNAARTFPFSSPRSPYSSSSLPETPPSPTTSTPTPTAAPPLVAAAAATAAAAAATAAAPEVAAEARVTFEACWKRLEARIPLSQLCIPREIIWLNGAPAAGKGANTPFILKHRGLTRTITISSLVNTNPDVAKLIQEGLLVPDAMIGDLLLQAIFDPQTFDSYGVLVDGFPRTALQADFLKLLFDQLVNLHRAHKHMPEKSFQYPRPCFRVVVLYVDEEESIKRQMKRAREAALHNQKVLDAGVGSLKETRTTDMDEDKARRRYQIFKAHYTTLLRLMQFFPFTLIDAMGSMRECETQISRELRYQSSLDLDEATYEIICNVPLAREVVRQSRQQLVARLDWYASRNVETFKRAVALIDEEIIPIVKRCSLAGHAEYVSSNPIFSDTPVAIDMLLDVLSDRGFAVSYRPDVRSYPLRVDMSTGRVIMTTEPSHKFRIQFESERIREHSQRGSGVDHSAAVDVLDKLGKDSTQVIGAFHHVPKHLDYEARHAIKRSVFALPAAAAAADAAQKFDLSFGYDENDLGS